ncbi:hypothetical protein [Streptococcus pneumoniae]|uniref:hypothetical protein n=1 Tax=Streptococcus pneumoniae TaxID=1313 RepID=UPI0005E5910D|nr:hypothetical protein [Streptococcus pneumoniae]COE03845.1 N-ethylammeline chlorohydrolase [Streptococcus pneumoniae]
MKIKEQTRKQVAGCSKQCFEVVDETDEVSNHTYGKAKLTWFEEFSKSIKMMGKAGQLVFFDVYRLVRQVS